MQVEIFYGDFSLGDGGTGRQMLKEEMNKWLKRHNGTKIKETKEYHNPELTKAIVYLYYMD